MDDRSTTLADMKARVRSFVADRQWEKYHRAKNLTMSLAVEAAELMEHFQWLDHDESDAMLRQEQARLAVAHEMADVLSFLLSLANAAGIDLAAAFEDKMARNEEKYPADVCRGDYRRPERL